MSKAATELVRQISKLKPDTEGESAIRTVELLITRAKQIIEQKGKKS